MTIELITNQLDRISADSWYDVTDNHIDLTINDFDGFDEDWNEIDREFVDEDLVDEVLEWLEKNADYVDRDFYHYYYFGEIVVEVEFEIVVEVIGETKMRVSILGPVESDCDTDDEEDEIDQQINPNFLKNSPFRGE